MGIIKYTDKKHEYLRAKSQFYYKPNVKSLKYFARILNITDEQLFEMFGDKVFKDEAITAIAREQLKIKMKEIKLKKQIDAQQKNYEKYVEKNKQKLENMKNTN